MRPLPLLLTCAMLGLAFAGCLSDGSAGVDGVADSVAQGDEVTFKESVYLLCPDYPTYGTYPTGSTDTSSNTCARFGEPTLEVAGDGTIWYSSVCCVGQSPPIWLSHDGGETFEPLPFADGTGVIRDAGGVEGDFAIDDAGNVYFFDITAATSYFTKYEADGTHVHTIPHPFKPLVDRPWVRAGVENEVWIFYNTAQSTVLHHSTDGGLTWDFPAGGTEFPCPLMTFGQGPERNDLVVSGCSGDPAAWLSHDGGQTFTDRIDLPFGEDGPEWMHDQRATESYMQPSMDAAGYSYIPVTHTLGRDPDYDGGGEPGVAGTAVGGTPGDPQPDVHTAISIYRIAPDGTVAGPFLASSGEGLVDKPWSIAGKGGVFAMAYYGADDVDTVNEEEALWDLKITYTLNGLADEPVWHTVVAHEAILQGDFGRQLGDFLQLRQTEDGGLAVAYASRETPQASLTNRFIRTDVAPDFGPEVFRNG